MINAIDFYKSGHRGHFAEKTEYVYGNLTPRSTKYAKTDYIVVAGLQGFCKKNLIEGFDRDFFNQPKEKVINKYKRRMDNALGVGVVPVDHLESLHDLGYLPIIVKGLPEGSIVPAKIPVLTIINTIPEFFWIVNYLETLLSAELWPTITAATIAYEYRRILTEYADKTGTPREFVALQGHDFSFRGLPGVEAAKLFGIGHLMSFAGTDTVPAIDYAEDYYNADSDKELVGCSVPATEHSVTTANIGNLERTLGSKRAAEKEFIRKLISEKHPAGIVSIVSDSFDYWTVVSEISAELKEEIRARKPVTDDKGNVIVPAKVVFRPDCYDSETSILTPRGWVLFKDLTEDDLVAQVLDDNSYEFVKPLKIVNQKYKGTMYHFKDHHGKIDLLVTPNHRMITQYTDKQGNVSERVTLAEKLGKVGATKGNGNHGMWRSAKAPELGTVLSDFERLKIAFQADGSYVTDSKRKIRFSFAKDRKKERLIELVNRMGLNHSVYDLKDDRVEIHIDVNDKTLMAKDFDWVDTSALSYSWCVDFMEELSHWDSSIRHSERFKFDTTNKSVVEVVELVAIGAGYGILISKSEDNRKEHFSDVYTAHIMKNNIIGGQARKKYEVDYDGTVHCVQVPTGRLLVKRGRGTMVCGNSGDPVKILTGYKLDPCTFSDKNEVYAELDGATNLPEAVKVGDKFFELHQCLDGRVDLGKELTEVEVKGSVEVLWNIFGGTTTRKGFRQLNEVGLIYGDSITLDRAKEIMQRLYEKNFASGNVVLGIGSFTYQYNTRDTYGIAMKATWCQVDGQGINIYKDPKTDDGTKKSAKGLLLVEIEDGKYVLYDEQTEEQEQEGELQVIFQDGIILNETSLEEIRGKLWQ